MKRYKRILVLLGVLAACCAATFALTRYEEHKEEIAVSGQTVLAVDPDAVTALSWTVDGESLAFHKDEAWQYDGDAAFPVDAEKIGEKLDVFADFAAAFTIENVEDYAQYGLDDPAGAITLTAGETTYEIKLGDFSQMDEQRYVDIGDGNVYLAASDPMDAFDTELSEMILDDTVPGFDAVSRIAFAGAENYEIDYDADGVSYSEDDVYFAGGEPLDTSLVESYLAALSGADLSTYATYNATGDELEAMGMNDPELTVTVDYTGTDDDGEEVAGTFTASIARAPDDRATLETAAADEDADGTDTTGDDITAYLRVGGSQIVYELPGADFTALMAAGYDDLRHQQLFWGDWDDVTAAAITLEGETHTLTAEGTGDDRVWRYNGDEVGADDAAGVTDALSALTAGSFTAEAATGQEEIALTLTLDSADVPQVEIRLTRYDGEHCLAEVDGESVALVPRAGAIALVEAVQAIVL